MRAVADTNTVVSALLWGGAPADILIAARQRRLALFTSAALIAELEGVLVRDKFAERISHIGMAVPDLLAGYRALAQFVRPTAIAAISRDPDDDHVLACAFAADAKLIVTREEDLLSLDPLRDIRILSAREALAILAWSPHLPYQQHSAVEPAAKAATDARLAGYRPEQIQVALAHTDRSMTEHYILGRDAPLSEVQLKLPERPKAEREWNEGGQ